MAMRHFRSLLLDVATANGTHCADMFLSLSEHKPTDEAALRFKSAMEALFHERCDNVGGTHAILIHGPTLRALQNAASNPPLNVGVLVNDIMSLVRFHGLTLEGEFAMVIVAISVLEGLARALDPRIDLVGGMVPFLAAELKGRAQRALRRLS